MSEGVKEFLSSLGLARHLAIFAAKGFDLEEDLPGLCEEDLTSMYILDPATRKTILQAAKHFTPSREFILYDWLRSKGLEHYFVCFIQSELVDLEAIADLDLPDEQIYDELEITLPGHKRRLERAVKSLVNQLHEHASNLDKAIQTFKQSPVAVGRWGKPRCLQDAKFDFLLLDATVVSTKDPLDRVDIEFMVDSGSDVVTMRQELLDTMDLELIGPINSKGVHASRVKNLYKANIQVGSEILEIEVMGESYDSIGSRVIRHFRHFINGSTHIWMKGDYVDPPLSPKTSKPEIVAQTVAPIGSATSGEVDVSSCDHGDIVPLATGYHDNQGNIGHVAMEGSPESYLGNPEENSDDKHSESPEDLTNTPNKCSKTDVEMVQSDSVKSTSCTSKDMLGALFNGETNEVQNVGEMKDDEKLQFKFLAAHSPGSIDSKTGHLNRPGGVDRETAFEYHDNEVDTIAGNEDEVDKLVEADNEIIDVRPIIAANRKRHASSNKGVGFGLGDRNRSPGIDSDRIVKRNRTTKLNASRYQESASKFEVVKSSKSMGSVSNTSQVENKFEVVQNTNNGSTAGKGSTLYNGSTTDVGSNILHVDSNKDGKLEIAKLTNKGSLNNGSDSSNTSHVANAGIQNNGTMDKNSTNIGSNTSHVGSIKVEEKITTVTRLNHRSVYYRAQSTDQDTEDS